MPVSGGISGVVGPNVIQRINSQAGDQADLASLLTLVQGTLITTAAKASAGTLSSVAASITSVGLLAADSTRKSFSIYNDDPSANLFIAFGATPTTTSFKFKIPPKIAYESSTVVWTGIINGIWDVASGNARISSES